MYWTNYAEDKLLRTFLGTTAVAPTAVYAALYLSNPGETGAGTEVSYPDYARQVITFTEPAVETGGASMESTQDIVFPESTISAGTVTHVALFDSLTGGNMLAYNTMVEPIVVQSGVAPLLQAGEWKYVTSGNLSSAYKVAILNYLRGSSVPGFLPHIALWNGSPDSGGAELSGGNYARFPVSFSVPAVQPAGQSMIAVAAPASSPVSNANWGTWDHTAIMTAASGGQVVAWKQRDYSYIMGPSTAAAIRSGELSVSLN